MEEVASKAFKLPPYGRSALPGTQAQDPFIQAHIKELNGAVGNYMIIIIIIIIVIVILIINNYWMRFLSQEKLTDSHFWIF